MTHYFEFCGVVFPECRPDMVYKQCSCPVTCENKTCDSTHCKFGCECPSGKYDDGTACVERKNCYCIIDGQQFEVYLV